MLDYTLFFWAVALVWFGWTLRLLRDVLALRRFPRERTLPSEEPRVSIVIAARDEAARIEGTLRRLLATRGARIELLVVDDRSVDGTGEILRRIAAEDPRLVPLRVDELPAGWLGKCHACELAGRQASGDWLLFTDGDIWIHEDAIARAVLLAREADAQHVVITPDVAHQSLAAKSGLLAVLLGLSTYMARANRDDRGGFFGLGAFNLVRADAWRAIGGHEKLRLEIVDDMKLGLLLARAGFRTRAYLGRHDCEAEWAPSLRGIVKATEKNLFAQMRFHFWLTLACGGLLLCAWVGAIAGLFAGGTAGACAFAGLLSIVLPAALLARRARMEAAPALLVPWAVMVLFLAIANSAWVTLRQGGVRWRGTLYTLDELRAGQVN
ncbi:MAG: glycosyltransferase [Planctomycetes bacterium]|nr:glycosyltransferase [Planctomycetota bacterium]